MAKLSKKLGKTEIKVLRAIANGTRCFDSVPECRAVWRLVEREYIGAEFVTETHGRFKHFNWGRNWVYRTERTDHVRVTAPKIEAAIAKHGLPLFLKSLAQEEAR